MHAYTRKNYRNVDSRVGYYNCHTYKHTKSLGQKKKKEKKLRIWQTIGPGLKLWKGHNLERWECWGFTMLCQRGRQCKPSQRERLIKTWLSACHQHETRWILNSTNAKRNCPVSIGVSGRCGDFSRYLGIIMKSVMTILLWGNTSWRICRCRWFNTKIIHRTS